jgi:hypothetical protein
VDRKDKMKRVCDMMEVKFTFKNELNEHHVWERRKTSFIFKYSGEG